MKISDEERIAAAEALRERTKYPLGKSMQLMFSETLGLYRTNIGWAKPTKATETWANIVNYLADLIDRPTCRKRIPDEMEGLVFCSNCGSEIGEYSVPNYCHNCGAKVVE